jgi:hypothetical protein
MVRGASDVSGGSYYATSAAAQMAQYNARGPQYAYTQWRK